MSWQALRWNETAGQARTAPIAGRIHPAIEWTGSASTEALRLVAAFLTPLAFTEAVLWVWRMGADLGFAGDFFIEDGIFSHAQVWLALAVGTQILAVMMTRWLKSLPVAQRVRR